MAFFIREAVVNLSELESIISQAQGRMGVLAALYKQGRTDDVLFEKAIAEIAALLKAAVDFEFQLEDRKIKIGGEHMTEQQKEKPEKKYRVKVTVDTTELDKLLEKLKEAKSLADEIASLSGKLEIKIESEVR